MSAKALIVERTLNAPAAQVWQALTDSRQMKSWYFDLPDFKPEPGFEFEFVAGKEDKQYEHICRVTQVIPGKKIAYSWKYKNYSGSSEVSFELFPEGEKTRLVLTHTGLESFPQNEPDFARESFSAGWNYIIGESLLQFIEGRD